MNVTVSKLLLGVSLAAYGYVAYDQFSTTATVKSPAAAGKELTAGLVNRTVVLHLAQDPFNSVPLNTGSVREANAQGAATHGSNPTDPGKDLGELKLDGVMVTVANRVAVINGKAMREGDSIPSPGGSLIRAVRIGVGYCIVEGAGRRVMLRVDDPQSSVKPGAPSGEPALSASGRQKPAAQSWITEHQEAASQTKQQIKDAPLPDGLKAAMTKLFEND